MDPKKSRGHPHDDGEPLPEALEVTQRLIHELRVHQEELEVQNAELREARGRIEALHHKYAELYERSPVAYLTLDRHGIIRECNYRATEALAVERQSLLGKPLSIYMDRESRDTFQGWRRLALTTRTRQTCELTLVSRAGDPVLVQIDGAVAYDEFGGGGDVILAAVTDVSELKRAQQEIAESHERLQAYSNRLEELVEERTRRVVELQRHRADTEKLAALGRLAARIAHQINNPLAGIKNAFLLVKEGVPEDYAYRAYVPLIEGEIDRIGRIVAQVFDLFQPEHEEPVRFILAEAVADVVTLLEPLRAKHQVEVVQDLPRSTLVLLQPAGVMRQVLFNVVGNAIEASPPGETVRIGATVDDDTVRLEVEDHGRGISGAVGERLFEPFFTTKSGRFDEGIGLGLSVSRSLVEMMGGALTFDSRPGEGTVFHVTLPQERSG